MKKLFSYVAVIVFIICTNSLLAQESAEELLQSLQNKFNSINSLSADFSQSVNGSTKLSGTVYYKKENNLRFEFQNLVIVSDGETTWNYNKTENKVIIVHNDESTNYLSIRQMIFDYPEECALSYSTFENYKVLTLVPLSSSLNFNSAKIFIDESDLIKRVIIDDPAGGMVQLDLSHYDISKNLQQSLFSFTLPEGSKIIDLR